MPAPDTPDALDALLGREPFALLDGGLASELERGGCDLDDPLWSSRVLLDQPEVLLATHRIWVEAGADILCTATYQATLPALLARGLNDAGVRAILHGAIDLARKACAQPPAGARSEPGRQLVAGSIGSYGASLGGGAEYRGDYELSVSELTAFHRPQVHELSAADLLAFETLPSAREARAIAELLAEREGPRAWLSFALRGPMQGSPARIADGTPLSEAVAPLAGHPRIAAVGVNCVGPEEVTPALEDLARALPGLPLIAYPNAGERWLGQAWCGPPLAIDRYVALAHTWLKTGARLIGGCCRTGPAHIEALAQLRTQLRGSELSA